MKKPLLLLIDLQNDYLSAPGLVPSRSTVVAGAAELLEDFRARGFPVGHVRTKILADGVGRMPHWQERGILSCAEGTPGYDGPVALAPKAGEPVFDKIWFSGFSNPELAVWLHAQAAGLIVLAGVHLQSCIRQTALDAYQNGYLVWLARDACASHDPLHGALSADYLADRTILSLRTPDILARLKQPLPSTDCTRVDLASVVAGARAAQTAWSQLDMHARTSLIRNFAEILRHEKQFLAEAIVRRVKKPIVYARGEVDRAVGLLNATALRAEALVPEREENEGCVRYRPRGVIGIITPWNNPLAIPVGKLSPALLYGNAVIWKPSPLAQEIAELLPPLLRRAGFPETLVQIIDGDERQARALIASGIDAVAFSGSSVTGWSVVAQAASRLLPVQAELGGNNAAIICPDADLRRTSAAIVEGAFGFAGQRCTANRRVIVFSEIYEAFLAMLEDAMRGLPYGDPSAVATRVSPMVSTAAAQRITATVRRCSAAGLRVIQPPAAFADAKADASFYPPTLVLCDDAGSFIVQEESFGPILVVQKAEDFDDALALLNGVPYGLVAALFSNDLGRKRVFLDRAEAGILKINASTVDAGVDLPFTGWKHSGYGAAEHGEANLEFFTKRQACYADS